jgi:hypothetical protein
VQRDAVELVLQLDARERGDRLARVAGATAAASRSAT